MKTLSTALLMILLVWMAGCQKQGEDSKTKMLLDSEVTGKNVTVVRAKEAVSPAETVTDLRELSTITEYDIQAKDRTPSREVVYVKPGQPVRPAETRQVESK